jgi:hypothetical protein
MEDNINDNQDVLDIFVKLGDLYINMIVDLETHLEEMGGTLQDFSPVEGMINVHVAPEHEAEVSLYIEKLIKHYNKERVELLKSDPFIGIKALLAGEDSN